MVLYGDDADKFRREDLYPDNITVKDNVFDMIGLNPGYKAMYIKYIRDIEISGNKFNAGTTVATDTIRNLL